MLITLTGWVLCLLGGVELRRHLRDPRRASRILFMLVIWVFAPLIVIYAYTTVTVDMELMAALGAVIAASWVTLLVGMAWGRLSGRERRVRAVLAFATGMGNTSSLGFPLAAIAFGGSGLALAAIYAEFQFLIPVEGVVLGLGRHYAASNSRNAAALGLGRLIRSWLLNPPVVAGAAAVAVRVLGVDISSLVVPIGPVLGAAFGLIGFVQVGLAVPPRPFVPDRVRARCALLTIVLRCGMAPLILVALGRLLGIHIPAVFMLLAAMPVAFNTLVVSAVFDLDAELACLLVATSTPLVIAAVAIWQMA